MEKKMKMNVSEIALALLLLPMFHTNAEERCLLGNRAFYKWFLKENEREAGGDDSSVFAIFLGL